ncbi:CoA-transferase [Conexibacter sp. CPCC 206217]|uniref:CoA-transferase n=1 Tax=Conexibacter sp. CPCC 206217 TaxID=3064574 RepID=UPI002716B41C|nr:CoA-transferase [Conexibacter sp. CPCC 206217]MDO8211026.1 CoA-transferase [Conexibacter sp. CPCC 206217]
MMPTREQAELWAAVIARELTDGDHCFIGLGTGGPAFVRAVGVPAVACELARLVHGRDVTVQYGVLFEPVAREVPYSFADAHLLRWRARAHVDVDFCLDTFRSGRMSVGFTSGVQIDREGNVNAVRIGSAERPKVRLTGPIAQTDHACFARRMICTMPHERRAFVERVDYVSAVGFPGGREGRRALGLPGGGPALVVSDLAVMDFDERGLMRLRSLHPGVTPADVRQATGFELVLPDDVPETEPPTPEERAAMRDAIDPEGRLLEARVR